MLQSFYTWTFEYFGSKVSNDNRQRKGQKMTSLDDLMNQVTELIQSPLIKPLEFDAIPPKTEALKEQIDDQIKPYIHLSKTFTELQDEFQGRQSTWNQVRDELKTEMKAVNEIEAKMDRVSQDNDNKQSALKAMESKVESKNNEVSYLEFCQVLDHHLILFYSWT